MKPYPIQLEISGPTALWTRPDTGSSPVSYIAPTFSAVKGIFESILRWKSVNVRPTRWSAWTALVLRTHIRRLSAGDLNAGGGFTNPASA